MHKQNGRVIQAWVGVLIGTSTDESPWIGEHIQKKCTSLNTLTSNLFFAQRASLHHNTKQGSTTRSKTGEEEKRDKNIDNKHVDIGRRAENRYSIVLKPNISDFYFPLESPCLFMNISVQNVDMNLIAYSPSPLNRFEFVKNAAKNQ